MKELKELNYVDLKLQKESFMSFLDVNELTIKSYKDGISHFIEYLDRNNIKKPTRLDFKAFRDELKQTMKVNTVNSYLTANRCFFRYLEANGIYENITKDVKSLKTSSIPTRQTLSKEKCQEIYKSLTDKREKCLFSLSVSTGLRGIEIARAKIEDIKEHNGEMVLWVQPKKHNSKDFYVKLSQQVLDDINEYIEHRTDGYIFVSTSNNNNGGGITTTTIRRIIKNIFKKFGINEDGFSMHSTRRTFATLAYNSDIDIYSIQQVLGHHSISTTQRYINQVVRDKNESEKVVSDLIFS